MKTLYENWKEYKAITLNYKNIEYKEIKKTRIEKGKSAWGGCCYNKGEIIGIVNSSRKVIAVDEKTDLVKLFAKTSIGTYKWTGGYNYKGKCYGFPRKANSILVIDPDNLSAYEIVLNTNYRGEHHYGGAITPAGLVYQPPRNTDHILRIDLNNMGTKRIGMPQINGSCRYSSIILHPNGNLYLIPEYGHRIAVMELETEKIRYFGEPSDYLVFGMVVGIDGNIYGFSKEGIGILKIDVYKEIVEHICVELGNPDCYGSVIGINGKIYGVPGGGNTVFEFDVTKQTACALFDLEERGYAKCAGGGIKRNGTIIMIPCFGEWVYSISVGDDSNIITADVDNIFLNTTY